LNLNGQLIKPASQADLQVISALDHGFLFGDSLYEVTRTYQRRTFGFQEHYARLLDSAKQVYFDLPFSPDQLRAWLNATLEAFFQKNPESKEAYVRWIVTRGGGRIGFGKEFLTSPPQTLLIAEACPEFSNAAVEKGTSLQVATRIRNHPEALSPSIKSGNYLNNLLATLEAKQAGFDDCILCDHEGHVTEGSRMNLGYIRHGVVITPPISVGILDGISRRKLFSILQRKQIPYRITHFKKERLYEADEVFVSSSIKEIFPVTRVDGVMIGNGKAGPLTLILRKAFREIVLQEST
jgi:branched-chain amino acid aminotransferase